jgi:hypothetical protein
VFSSPDTLHANIIINKNQKGKEKILSCSATLLVPYTSPGQSSKQVKEKVCNFVQLAEREELRGDASEPSVATEELVHFRICSRLIQQSAVVVVLQTAIPPRAMDPGGSEKCHTPQM